MRKGTVLCTCIVATGLVTGAVLAQVAISLPGNNAGGDTPSWNQPNQGVRTLYVTSFDNAGSVLPATVVAAQNRMGDMVKASAMADDVQFVQDVGTKTIIDVTNPDYGHATVELALPAVHDVMVDLVFVAPGRVEAIVHGQTVTTASTAPGGAAVAHPACPGDGDCCDPAGNGTPGCDDADCCNLICDSIDPFCCDSFWDSLCAGEALANCPACVVPGCDLLDCPPGGLDEGEPCGDDTNGGCNSSPPIFTDASCGDTFYGNAWAAGGTRDTDWYLVNHPGGTISGTLISQFPGVCFIVGGVGPGGVPCAPAVLGDIGCSQDCATIQVASASAPAGTIVVFVSVGDCAGGGIFDGLPCGGGNNDYCVTIDCEGPCQSDDDCPPGQVCVDGICILPPPTNDTCDTAIALDVPAGGSDSISGTTIDATIDPFTCVTSTTAPGVWYDVVGNGNVMTASTCNQADYDTKISVFCGDCGTGGGGSDCCIANGTPGCDDPTCEGIVCAVDPFCCDVAWDSICAGEAASLCGTLCTGGLICVDGVDDTAGCGLTTEVTWCAKAGATYHILVHGFSSAVGNFTLTVSDNGQACTPTVDCPVACQSDDDCPPGFVCIDGDCVEVPTGACCQCDDQNQLFCSIETEADCMAFDGLYLGDGAACEAGGNDLTYTSSPALSIPDDNATGVSDTITVSDSFNVVDIKVALNITHTWVGDLCALLSKDGGPELAIMQRINDTTGLLCDGEGCCGCSSDNVNCTLWDGAADAVNDQCGWSGALTGTFSSESFNLSTFAGGDAAGDWTLRINDSAAGDTGVLNSWSLILTAPASGQSPCEAAGFSCNEPPDCSGAYASVDGLWPPNHTMHDVSIAGVVDPDGDPITITITGIYQDEDPEGIGSGNTCPDAMGVGTDTAQVRAERQGVGDGRVYHIYFTADDGQGGTCEGEVTVCVPHDQGQGSECVDGGPLYDSTSCGGMADSFDVPGFGGQKQ